MQGMFPVRIRVESLTLLLRYILRHIIDYMTVLRFETQV